MGLDFGGPAQHVWEEEISDTFFLNLVIGIQCVYEYMYYDSKNYFQGVLT